MNYMEQVAQMLGVELGEEFRIRKGNNSIKKDTFYLTKGGMYKNGSEFPVSSLWDGILAGYYEIVKIPKPILDKEEKEYLSNIIKPFRDCVKYIFKQDSPDYEYIVIEYYDKPTEVKCKMFFPCFEKDKMYKGMQLYKKYKLDELGL